jgi:hypothetical protein
MRIIQVTRGGQESCISIKRLIEKLQKIEEHWPHAVITSNNTDLNAYDVTEKGTLDNPKVLVQIILEE